MATLSGNKIKDTYQSLIKLTDNGNLTTGAKRVTDGFGNNSPLFLSTTQIGIGVTPTVQFHASGDGKFGGNLTVIGNLVVEGSTTTVGTDTLTVKDPLIVLANNNTSSDAVDIGFYGKYRPSSTTLFSGLFRDAGDDKFKLFKSLQVEPTTTVNTSGTGYTVATLVSNLEGNVTGNLTGNADTATALETARTIQVSGDVAGSASFDGTANINISTTIQANSVELGTDTTGNYVATISGTTNEIEVSGSGSETASVTIGLPDDVTVTGNLTVNGTGINLSNATNPSITVTDTTNGHYLIMQGLDGGSKIDYLSTLIFEYGAGNTEAARLTSLGLSITEELTVSGTGQSSFGGQVTIPATPSASTDAASKGYVDSKFQETDTLSEVLALGNTTGATKISVNNTSSGIDFIDNAKARFGTGNDLEIYHNGTNSVIDSNTNNLFIQTASQTIINSDATNNQLTLGHSSGNWFAKATNSNTLIIGSESNATNNITLDTTNGGSATFAGNVIMSNKLGIGTTTPQKDIHIEGASGASASQLLVCGASDTIGHTAGILLRAEGGESDSSLRAKGAIFFEREAANGLGKLHLCNNNSNNNDSADLSDAALTINQDKSATFAGNVIIDGSNGSTGLQIKRPSDSAVMQGMSAPDSSTLKIGGGNQTAVKIFSHTTEVASFSNTGATTFAGRVIIGDDAITTDKPGLVVGDTTNGGQITIRGLSPTLFFDKTGSNNPKILTDGGLLQIKSGTLDSEGSVLMSLTNTGATTFAGAVTGTSFSATGGFLNGSNGGIRIHTTGTKFFNVTAANAARDNIMDIGASDARFKDLFLGGSINSGAITTSGLLTSTLAINQSSLPNAPSEHVITLNPPTTTNYYGGGISWSEGSNTAASLGVYDAGSGGALGFYIATGNNTTLTQALTIDSSQNVGIGTSSPPSDHKLQIHNAGGAFARFALTNSATGTGSGDGLKFQMENLNSIIKNQEAGYLTFGTSGRETDLRIDSAGNVGIGTTSPSRTLHVASDDGVLIKGASGSANGKISFLPASGGRQYDLQNVGSDFRIFDASAGVTRMYFDNDGNTGIGTTSPAAKLDVQGSSALFMTRTSSGLATYIENDGGYAAQYMYQLGAGARIALHTNGNSYFNGGNVGIGTTSPVDKLNLHGGSTDNLGIQFNSNASGSAGGNGFRVGMNSSHSFMWNFRNTPLAFATGGTQKMTLSTSGLLGIGTTSPGYKLQVSGAQNANDIVINNTTTGVNLRLQMIDANGAMFTTGSKDLLLGTNNTEKMRIDSSGQVMMRRTTDYDGSNLYFLQVGDASLDNGTPIVCTVASTASRNQIVFSNNSSNIVGQITTAASATSYNTSSDYRLKEDLQEFNGLEKVSNIKVYDFKWKEYNNRSYGVLAHELEEVLPQAVTGEKDAEEMQSVDYSKIVPILVKSIQELEQRIKQLEDK